MRTAKIGELVDAVTTWNPSRSPAIEFEYIDLSAVDNGSKAVVGPTTVTGAEAPSRARQVVSAGDVLVSTVRPNLNAVAVVPAELEGATASTGFTVLRPGDELDGRFLFHWVQSPLFISDMVRKATGASYPAVSDRIVKDSAIPAPPLPEQRRIAAILDHADALRAKRRQVLTHLDALVQSVFHQMFDLGSDHVPFAAACERVTVGVVIKPASHYVDSGVPALRTLNVKPGRIVLDDLVYFSDASNDGPLAKSRLRVGDLVIARTGKAGTTAIVPPELDGANAIDLIIATPNTNVASPIYLETLLNSETGKRVVKGEARGQIQQHFNVGSLKNASVPLPPVRLQLQFAERVEQINRQRANLNDATRADAALFASVQYRAFRGEL